MLHFGQRNVELKHFKQRSSFLVPLDKGIVGSGNEIGLISEQEDASSRLRGMYWFSKNYVEWRWKVE